MSGPGQDDPGVTRSIDWYKCSRLPVDPLTLENESWDGFFREDVWKIGILRNHATSLYVIEPLLQYWKGKNDLSSPEGSGVQDHIGNCSVRHV